MLLEYHPIPLEMTQNRILKAYLIVYLNIRICVATYFKVNKIYVYIINANA